MFPLVGTLLLSPLVLGLDPAVEVALGRLEVVRCQGHGVLAELGHELVAGPVVRLGLPLELLGVDRLVGVLAGVACVKIILTFVITALKNITLSVIVIGIN